MTLQTTIRRRRVWTMELVHQMKRKWSLTTSVWTMLRSNRIIRKKKCRRVIMVRILSHDFDWNQTVTRLSRKSRVTVLHDIRLTVERLYLSKMQIQYSGMVCRTYTSLSYYFLINSIKHDCHCQMTVNNYTTWLSHDCKWLQLYCHMNHMSRLCRMIFERMSHERHTIVSRQSHDCHTTVTRLSHDRHTTDTRLSHDYHTTVTRLTHDCHTTDTRYLTATRLSHVCHKTVTRAFVTQQLSRDFHMTGK